MSKVLLIVPPFSTPFAPPLGVAVLKGFLQSKGHNVKCVNLNVNHKLWNMHHEYFHLIDQASERHLNGYSLYWNIINPHLLAYVNDSSKEECLEILHVLFKRYSMENATGIMEKLVELVENYFETLEKILLEKCQIGEYSYIGTSTYTTSLASSLFIHKITKKYYPETITMIGGGVFTDDLSMGTENMETLVSEYDYVDKIVVGEGELLLLKTLENEFADQKVISLKDIDNETFEMNESKLPDFSDFDIDRYYHLTIEGARSCPYTCKFCSEKMQWGPFRKKEAAFLAKQMISLKNRYDKQTFFMGDAIMNFYIEDLTRELFKQNAEILFDGYLRAEPEVMIRDNTKYWSEAGLYRVRLGMESASPKVLKMMNKGITPENMSECLKSLSSAGIRTTTYWVIGFPGETEEDFQQTLDFIRENHKYIYELEAHPYYYFPNGQRISSDYDYECIYPQDIISKIKFKTYDIVNASPSRDERLERLKRVSDLSSELGIINIYSMMDMYEAEDRWISLYPSARVIYD
ncbi:MAG: radical SAM protein [Halanaerobiales bacterium]|nr:radical SAM protein [Halanaerobiales bacterium]